jgi:hypothetical protein
MSKMEPKNQVKANIVGTWVQAWLAWTHLEGGHLWFLMDIEPVSPEPSRLNRSPHHWMVGLDRPHRMWVLSWWHPSTTLVDSGTWNPMDGWIRVWALTTEWLIFSLKKISSLKKTKNKYRDNYKKQPPKDWLYFHF